MRYFIDCEFDGWRGPLISMALIRDDGRSLHFYDPVAEESARDPWVIENVLPLLKDCPQPPTPRHPQSAAYALQDFLEGDEAPHIVADWPADLVHLGVLLETSPGVMLAIPGLTCEVKRVDAYPTSLTGAVQHNAWWDALALRQKVLEMEAEGEAAEGFGDRPELKLGDVVILKGHGVPMTVTEDPFRGEVSVTWFDITNALREASLPEALLMRV